MTLGHILSFRTKDASNLFQVPVIDEKAKEFLAFPKVELHVHLDGAVRHKTLLDLSIEKGISLNGAKTEEEVRKVVVTHEAANLSKVLQAFDLFLPVLVGDKDAIERVAYEMCEDEAKNGVIYFEARYSPHLLSNTAKNLSSMLPGGAYSKKGPLDPRGVVQAVKRGFDRGEVDFKVKARSILCCIHGYTDWNEEVLELASTSVKEGVVGIDIAGCAKGADEQYPESVSKIFQQAASKGIHRTVHAGESGGADSVINAVKTMQAERIGHGYRLLSDESAYKEYALEKRIHFEMCPHSSIMTGSVPLKWAQHPLKKFAADNTNYSINTDDPTCFENSLLTDYQIAHVEIGLSRQQLVQASLNAAKSCFAEDDVKQEIVSRIEAAKAKIN